MSTREDELALLLARLVVPNFPHLKGTDIAVLDAQDCAKRGTEAERRTAREVRGVIDEMWELDEGSPVRRMLEGIYLLGKASEVESPPGEAPVRRASAGHRLPTEVLQHIWRGTIQDATGEGRDPVDFVVFQKLRLVSLAVREYAELHHERVADRFVNRVARHLLHVTGPISTRLFSEQLCSCAGLLNRARELQVVLRHLELHAINQILFFCHNIVGVTIFTVVQDPALNGLDLSHNRRLKTFKIATSFQSGWKADGERYPAAADLWGTDAPAAGVHYALDDACLRRRPSVPPSLRTFELDNYSGDSEIEALEWSYYDDDERFSSVSVLGQELGEVTIFGEPVDWGCIGACLGGRLRMLRITWASLDDANLATLVRLESGCLQELDLQGNEIHAAVSLAIYPLLASLDLSNNPLRTWTMHLAGGTALRVLRLTRAFVRCTSETRVSLIADFGADFALNESVEELSLNENGLTDEEVRTLRLGHHKSLRKLSLQNNRITDEGVAGLALQHNSILEEVDLRFDNHPQERVTQETAQKYSTATRAVLVGSYSRR